MKTIYQKPTTTIYKLDVQQFVALSRHEDSASTTNGYYDSLTKEENDWDDDED